MSVVYVFNLVNRCNIKIVEVNTSGEPRPWQLWNLLKFYTFDTRWYHHPIRSLFEYMSTLKEIFRDYNRDVHEYKQPIQFLKVQK